MWSGKKQKTQIPCGNDNKKSNGCYASRRAVSQ